MIKGPFLIKVLGECEILGKRFKNTFIKYENNKIIPIEKKEKTIITIKNGYFINFKKLKMDQEYVGTRIWNNVINQIIKTNRKNIIIIGSSDTGKSTLTLYISNFLIKEGLKPIIIDSDIGQGELSPPGCIGTSTPSKQTIDLSKHIPKYINFIGDIQPKGYEKRIINCIWKAKNKAHVNDGVIIINTDGYVSDNGENYKIDLIEKINPDCIICMSGSKQGTELFEIIKNKSLNNKNVLILDAFSPCKDFRKSPYDRREKRLKEYSKLNRKFTKKVTISKEKLSSIYYKNNFFYNMNTVNSHNNNIQLNINDLLSESFLQNRYIGLSLRNDDEKIIGFGIITNYSEGLFSIKSSIQEFDSIFLSDIKLFFNIMNEFKK
ncbi:MAG TPA: Clp1/GlmU family protein [Verrucomicrobiae bacterium]|nr:Clp1/GlmU family protein [Verrucomicrobiae bacterium]